MPQTLAVPHPILDRPAGELFPFGRSLCDGGLDAAWVRVVGELDLATTPQLEQMLRSAGLHARRLVLDLCGLSFIDGCGVHAIVNASRHARARGQRLVLVRGPPQVHRVFVLTKTVAALEIVDLDPIEPPVQALLQLAQRHRTARRDHAA